MLLRAYWLRRPSMKSARLYRLLEATPAGREVYLPLGFRDVYRFTRLEADGWLSLDGERFQVRGQAWMDKEVGSNQLTKEQVGWDWFSLQLSDGRDLMLYVIRRKSERRQATAGG